MFVTRTDTDFPTVEITDGIPKQRFITILGGQFNYLFYFQNAVPKNVFLTGSSITKSCKRYRMMRLEENIFSTKPLGKPKFYTH